MTVKIKSVEAFLDMGVVKLPGGSKENCDESKEFVKKYAEQNNISLQDVDPRDHLHRLMDTKNIPLQYIDRAQLYLSMPRALIAAVGRQGVEDTGEWRVNHWDNNDNNEVVVNFSCKEDCVAYVNEQLEKDYSKLNWGLLYSISYLEERIVDPGTERKAKVTTYISKDEVFQFAENFKFDVKSKNGYVNEKGVLRDNVPALVEKAIKMEKDELIKEFTIYKRLRPKGHETWGNWWKQVPIV